MENKIIFTEKNPTELFAEILSDKFPKNSIFNFLNSHSIYLFRNHKVFREHVLRKNNLNFIDGFMISLVLSIKNLRIVKRLKGHEFSDAFFKKEILLVKKKQLFLGVSDLDMKKMIKKYPLLKKENCFSYDIPLLKKEKFDDSELVKKIKKIKPNYIWVAIGNPKQEIISNDLAEKITADYFFNVGAFFDYAKNKKKQSPKIFQKLGIEWFYRLITDFNHTWKKVKRSFVANKYLLNTIRLK